MSDRSLPPPDERGVILFGNAFRNVGLSLNELLNGVVLDEEDLDSLLSTAHKLEGSSQTIVDGPVDSVPAIYKDDTDYDDIDGDFDDDFDDDDEDSENNQEGKSEEGVEAEKTEEGGEEKQTDK